MNTVSHVPAGDESAPVTNVNEFRLLGHQVVDLLADYLEHVDQARLFPQITPAELRKLFDEPLPQDGTDPERILLELQTKLLPYCTHVNHPGYMGLITPSPTPIGIVADFIASAINQNPFSYLVGPSATEMERRTLQWLARLVGFGPSAGGNLTSGGTMANLIGIKLGRDFASRNSAQHDGTDGSLRAYVSEERQVSIDKAIDVVGIGRANLRIIPTDDEFRIRMDALETAVAEDRKKGFRPAILIAGAGTTNTGSVDPLVELSAFARREGLWVHVDAAYGGGVLLSKRREGLLKGLELADSVTIDPHKWFYAPVDAGAVIVRNEKSLTDSFGIVPPYLTSDPDQYQFYVHGLEQSRRFRSLKVWMAFKRYGAAEIGRWIDRNIEQAERLYELSSRDADIEPVHKPSMSAICLRFHSGDADLHQKVVAEIQRQGKFWISTTVLKGRPAIRINPVNFRTTLRHMDELFGTLKEVYRKLRT
ncbi:MAG: aminotransferase class I/II-fold pyridoxal phosphate-dependent enzyme [Planctomycetes bacterium]|nr:aminotransferase class I/II-fold pyridoxal phosphate-dependent enzyme [Planctomycetota bacterium]